MPLKPLLICSSLLLGAAAHAADGEPASAAPAVPAPTAAPASTAAAYQAAGKAFLARITDAEAAHDPAMVGGDQANELIAVLSDEKRFLKPGPYAAGEMVELEGMCSTSSQVESALMRFDSKAITDGNDNPQNKMIRMLLVRRDNAEKFSPILAKLAPFRYRCFGKLSKPLLEAMSVPGYQMTADGKTTLDNLRARSFMTILDGATFFNISKSDEERVAVAKALAENIGDVIQPLPLGMRQTIDRASQVPSTKSPANLKPYWDTVFTALGDTTCNVVCKQ